jgi:hypothetical protein
LSYRYNKEKLEGFWGIKPDKTLCMCIYKGPIMVGRKKLTMAAIIHTIRAMPSALSQPTLYKMPRAISQAIPPMRDANHPNSGLRK